MKKIFLLLFACILLASCSNSINRGDFTVLVSDDNDTLIWIGNSNLFVLLTDKGSYFGEFEVIKKHKGEFTSYYYIAKLKEYSYYSVSDYGRGFVRVMREEKNKNRNSNRERPKPSKEIAHVSLLLYNIRFTKQPNITIRDSMIEIKKKLKNNDWFDGEDYCNDFRKHNISQGEIDRLIEFIIPHYSRSGAIQQQVIIPARTDSLNLFDGDSVPKQQAKKDPFGRNNDPDPLNLFNDDSVPKQQAKKKPY